MGFDTLKFAVPREALKASTELNLGYCKEIQKGVWGKDEDNHDILMVVDWDNCTDIVSFGPGPEDTVLNITRCKEEPGYDWSHDCNDGVMDLSKCMEGNQMSHVSSKQQKRKFDCWI